MKSAKPNCKKDSMDIILTNFPTHTKSQFNLMKEHN